MRRGGRARRAMLGAVATGALLGAAQGFNLGWKSLLASATAQSDGEAGGYTGRAVSVSSWGNRLAVGEAKADESKSQVSAEMSPVHRRRLAARRLAQQGTDYPTIDFNPNADTDNTFDGTYKVVTASGLEIDIDSTSDTGVYTIAPFGPSTSGGFPTIEVAGGDLSACTSDITLNLNAGKITCTVAGSQAGNTTYTTLMINGESPEEFDLQVSDCVGDGLNLFVDESAGKITCEVDTAVAGTPQTYPAGLTGDTLSSLDGDLVSVSDCKDGAITLIGDGKTGGITCQVNVQVAGGSVETATATFTVTESSGDSAPPVDLSTCTAVTVDGDEIASARLSTRRTPQWHLHPTGLLSESIFPPVTAESPSTWTKARSPAPSPARKIPRRRSMPKSSSSPRSTRSPPSPGPAPNSQRWRRLH